MTAVTHALHNCEPDRQTDGCDHFARAVDAFVGWKIQLGHWPLT
jgi:hypothetical protein